jgi:ribosomal protein S18 acetylase RimI-like enzyme
MWLNKSSTDGSLSNTAPNLLLSAVQTYQAAFAQEPWNEYFTMEEVLDTFSHLVEKGDLGFAISDNRVIGFVGGFPYSDGKTYYIDELAIHPDCQGKGYGGLLLKEFMTKFSHRFNRIELRTSAQNQGAMGLYIKYGFVPTGKSEIQYQVRQDGQIRLDERIYLCNDFHLNRVVVVERNESTVAIVFDKCYPQSRSMIHSQIQERFDRPTLTTCFIDLPRHPDAMVRFNLIGSATKGAIESSLIVMTQGKDYEGVYETDSGTHSFAIKSEQVVTVLHDGRLKLI